MYLATVAITTADNDNDGSTAVEIPSQPATGNQFNLTENAYCSNTAKTNEGTDTAITEIIVADCSCNS